MKAPVAEWLLVALALWLAWQDAMVVFLHCYSGTDLPDDVPWWLGVRAVVLVVAALVVVAVLWRLRSVG